MIYFMYFHRLFLGMINRVQGFVSQTVSLVDTTPTVNKRTAFDIIKKVWNHKDSESSLDIAVKRPELQILQGVSINNINKNK